MTDAPQEKLETAAGASGQEVAPQARHRLVLPGPHGDRGRAPQAGRRRPGQFLPRPGPGHRGRNMTRPSRRSKKPRRPATPGDRCSCSGPASTGSKGDIAQARTILPKLEEHEHAQCRVSFPAGQLLLGRGRQARGDQAPGTGRRTRSRPHRRPVPARPCQRPGRQRRRRHQLLRALPESSAGPRRRRS